MNSILEDLFVIRDIMNTHRHKLGHFERLAYQDEMTTDKINQLRV